MRNKLLGLLLFVAGPALAADGVFEINQLCVSFGCFEGDAPGFPVNITNDGSYILTSDLVISDADDGGIVATANVVTLDLNGFKISGPVNCTGSPVSACSPSGTGVGVSLDVSGSSNSVSNGVIEGMGANGLVCRNCRVSNITARSNGLDGITQVGSGKISDSLSLRNGERGISSGGIVENSVVRENGFTGIVLDRGILRGSSVFFSGGSGIVCTSTCSLLDNLSIGNSAYGIVFAAGFNSSFGRNNSNENDVGAVFGTARQLGSNSCDGGPC